MSNSQKIKIKVICLPHLAIWGRNTGSTGVAQVFQGWILGAVFLARGQFHPHCFRNQINTSMFPQTRKSLSLFPLNSLVTCPVDFFFFFPPSVFLTLPKAGTEVLGSGNSFTCPPPQGIKTHTLSKKVVRGALSVFFGFF